MPRRIYKRGRTWWLSVGSVRESTGCKDKGAAELFFKRRQRELADPHHAAKDAATLADAVARHLADLRRARRQDGSPIPEGTIGMFRTKSGHLLRLLPPHLADINARTVAAYFEAREVEGAHYATLSKEWSALKATLRSAKQCDLYSGDIGNLKPIWVKPSYVPRETFISWEDVPKLLAALEPARRAVVAFITATGARWSEAMSFQPGDLDRACWSILIRGTKTRKAWRNFIVPEAFRGLLDHVGGAFAPWGNVVRDLEIACKHAGVNERRDPEKSAHRQELGRDRVTS